MKRMNELMKGVKMVFMLLGILQWLTKKDLMEILRQIQIKNSTANSNLWVKTLNLKNDQFNILFCLNESSKLIPYLRFHLTEI